MKEFATDFKRPTKFGAHFAELSITIGSDYAGAVFFTRRYLDVNRQTIGVLSSQVAPELYGKGILRLPVNDAYPIRAYYIECVLTDSDETVPFAPGQVVDPGNAGFEFDFDYSQDFNS